MEPRLKWNKIILAAKIIMVAVWNRADHYIFNSSCGFFLFSSPDFSRRRLDVCRTTTHVVALVRIYNAMQVWNVLHAARWKCRMQKNRQKNRCLGMHHRTIVSGYIFPTKAHIDNRKKWVKQQYLLHMSSQYGELWHTSGWDRFVSLGNPR